MFFKSVFYEEPINIKFSIPYIRYYGDPKLQKPKELKGIKEAFSVDYIPKKCKCKVYIVGDDVWIHHRDFFSQTIYDHNVEFRKKFIYNDTFGCIVLRNEAYIHIKDFCKYVDNYKLTDRIMELWEKEMNMERYTLVPSDNERMIENIVNKIYKRDF